MATQSWPTTDPIGVRIRLGDITTPWITIVGVVTDLKLNWYDPEPRPTIVVPHTQAASRQMRVMVRATSDPTTLAGAIRAIVSQLDPLQPTSEMRRVDDVVAESISPVRVIGLLLLIGGALAIGFSATGIYGVLAHWVTVRRREFGIRIALGASGTAVAQLILTQVLTLAVIGLSIGLPLGFMGLALLRSRLFGLAAIDAATVGEVSAFVMAVATIAALVPANRARRSDPAALLQSE
jgi:predicted lysophospholipase L1 biosynthesis ABC-type transport system permease subunit